MRCPMCGGDFDNVTFRTISGSNVYAKHCNQCSGIWFERQPVEQLSIESVQPHDAASPNYSLKHLDLICPNDESLLEEADATDLPAGSRYWQCPDCNGSFYPKGQLALLTASRQHTTGSTLIHRPQTALIALLVVVGVILINASLRQVEFQASVDQVLPTSGPNILTLGLLALAYLAGTILAVLGRRLPIVMMGWGVITICLLGFFVIIFGP